MGEHQWTPDPNGPRVTGRAVDLVDYFAAGDTTGGFRCSCGRWKPCRHCTNPADERPVTDADVDDARGIRYADGGASWAPVYWPDPALIQACHDEWDEVS